MVNPPRADYVRREERRRFLEFRPVLPDERSPLPRASRIVIADDHELARSGLRAMIEGEDDLLVVGEARDGLEVVELCRREAPDLALLDVRMPRMDGMGAARALNEHCPGVRIVMVTMHDSPEYLSEALSAGASGYVLKDASRRELLGALRTVLAGETFLNGAVAARLIEGLTPRRTVRSPVDVLTPRETRVLGLVARGMTNKEVGRELDISPATAKAHVERIIGKLGVADRTQAAVRGVECGLVCDAP